MTLLKDNDYKEINVALLSLEADIKNKITGSFDTSEIDKQLAEINSRIDKINTSGGSSSSDEIEDINSKLNSNSIKIKNIEQNIEDIGTQINGIEQKLSDIFSAENKVTDFNTTTDSGIYYWVNDAANRPTDYGVLLVNKYDGGSTTSIWVNQIAYGTDNKIYFRQNINSTGWTGWQQLATTDSTLKTIQLSGTVDCNTLTEPGLYTASSDAVISITNTPANIGSAVQLAGGFSILVTKTNVASVYYGMQMFIPYGSDAPFIRKAYYLNGQHWTSWEKLVTNDDIFRVGDRRNTIGWADLSNSVNINGSSNFANNVGRIEGHNALIEVSNPSIGYQWPVTNSGDTNMFMDFGAAIQFFTDRVNNHLYIRYANSVDMSAWGEIATMDKVAQCVENKTPNAKTVSFELNSESWNCGTIYGNTNNGGNFKYDYYVTWGNTVELVKQDGYGQQGSITASLSGKTLTLTASENTTIKTVTVIKT